MDVLVDFFGDSHGIDTAETVATMMRTASLNHIGTVERVADGPDFDTRWPQTGGLACVVRPTRA